MCVPRKEPHPFGNEYHSIADRDDGKSIMWRVKIVEGKNRPKRANGQYAMAGTGLAQGDKPEVLNAYLEKMAHLIRNLSRANTAAHFEVSLLQFNEHLQLTVVQRLVKLRNAARARLENVVRSRQTLVANDRQAPTNA